MNNRNVEIKGKLHDIDYAISKAKELSGSNEAIIIKQHDTFFNAIEGRLKIRKFDDNAAEYIFYKRPNVLGPKLCNYNKIALNSDVSELLMNILSESMGVVGVVKKIRRLFIVGQTRIHVDQVDGLGNFIELEVVLQEDQDIETGQKIANDLMQALSITNDDLVAEAYIDLLKKVDI
ncbi:uncharacterized protein LOC116846697 [Odontomachus brunneus]|uniref:uncharacterized protein LOC116846697 n=1 Tax=Odontomachus brunneus TaxID=486640 RepID=UPI0013F1D0CC|nr:uncharacterized protein LOC116846697 [Odontomachus brunneus]XP_032676774.1 uncharacterized protein LOC116846697 [Odontomachus brunneus]XP_032676775.1 uncharacterized protein LOC116846697 [Odontomachus brunneus]